MARAARMCVRKRKERAACARVGGKGSAAAGRMLRSAQGVGICMHLLAIISIWVLGIAAVNRA